MAADKKNKPVIKLIRSEALDIKAPRIRFSGGYFDFTHNVFPVAFDTDKKFKKAVYTIALYFRREFHFDFVGYDEDEKDPNRRAYLFFPDDARFLSRHYGEVFIEIPAIGAACFRYLDEYEEIEPGWAMQWIWIHPFYRRRGLLDGAWKQFLKDMDGPFYCEGPLSEGMKKFLQKHEHKKGLY